VVGTLRTRWRAHGDSAVRPVLHIRRSYILQGVPRSLRFYTALDPSRATALVRVLLERSAVAAPVAAGGGGVATGGPAAAVGRCLALLRSIGRFVPRLPALALLQVSVLQSTAVMWLSWQALAPNGHGARVTAFASTTASSHACC
jgi:hypothetical protein